MGEKVGGEKVGDGEGWRGGEVKGRRGDHDTCVIPGRLSVVSWCRLRVRTRSRILFAIYYITFSPLLPLLITFKLEKYRNLRIFVLYLCPLPIPFFPFRLLVSRLTLIQVPHPRPHLPPTLGWTLHLHHRAHLLTPPMTSTSIKPTNHISMTSAKNFNLISMFSSKSNGHGIYVDVPLFSNLVNLILCGSMLQIIEIMAGSSR